MDQGKSTTFGIIGGMGPLAGADFYFKFVKSTPACDDGDHFNIILEQKPIQQDVPQQSMNDRISRRKFQVYDVIKDLVSRSANCMLLNCFISHTFIDELEQSLDIPILNMMDSLVAQVDSDYPQVKRIGVLTSDYVREKKLFESYFNAKGIEILYPADEVQTLLMDAVYGPEGIKAGHLSGKSVDNLVTTCHRLADSGAELILPGITEIPVVLDSVQQRTPVPIIDCNQVYANWAIHFHTSQENPVKPCKIGIIGGLGPSATIDLMDKIVQNTPADRDQDHLQMLVEHNPKIPDRTSHLLTDGEDPTIPMYTCAKRLEEQGADFIAVPCNTAHAFVERIQHHISIPFVHMIDETAIWLRDSFPAIRTVGLLATSGTVETGIYHQSFAKTDIQLITPDEEHQELVMQSIYGDSGVKAGYTTGKCREQLLQAAAYLVHGGAEALILGCTELPLILEEDLNFSIAEKTVLVIDPTAILARKCVALSTQNK